MTDETPTPPVGIMAQQRAAARGPATSAVATLQFGTGRPSGLRNSTDKPYRVVIADDPAAWSDAYGRKAMFELTAAERVTAFERLTAGQNRLVILCGHRQAARVNREVAVVRGLLDARVAVVPLPGGPLGQYATARIADQALAVAGRPATLIVSLLGRLAEQVVDLGLVGAVNALDIPGIRLRHHVRSYLPGSHLFAVQLTPSPFITAIDSDELPEAAGPAFAAPDFGPGGARVLRAGPREIPPALQQAIGVTGAAHPVKSHLDLAGYWKDEQATEVVVVPADPVGWVVAQVPVQNGVPCNWCGESLSPTATSCVFCGNLAR